MKVRQHPRPRLFFSVGGCCCFMSAVVFGEYFVDFEEEEEEEGVEVGGAVDSSVGVVEAAPAPALLCLTSCAMLKFNRKKRREAEGVVDADESKLEILWINGWWGFLGMMKQYVSVFFLCE